MKTNFQKTFLFLLIAISGHSIFALNGNSTEKKKDCRSHLSKARIFFQNRADGAFDWHAKNEKIDSAIFYFTKSIQCKDEREEAAQFLLRSLHFKAMYTDLSDERRKEIFNQVKIYGEAFVEEYPQNVGIKLWYLAGAGKWIQYYGIIRAAYDGIGPKIKRTCEDIINLDPLYENGIGYRMLGVVYYEAPYIPIILTWPDKQKGLALARKSLEINPDNIGNLLFLGKMLFQDKQYLEAKKYLIKCTKQIPRQDYLIMERYDQMKAQFFLDQMKNEGN